MTEEKHECKYCLKSFKRASTLAVHQCEKKRRWQQESSSWVQLGLRAYQKFYETTHSGNKAKTYADFVVSPYYTAFVKFGSYCQQIRCVNFSNFLEWLLKNNKKIDYWTRDSLYNEWLVYYTKHESCQDAVERTVLSMQDYADEHPELKNGLLDYFRLGNKNKIISDITSGRISPWVMYLVQDGIDFLGALTEEEVSFVYQYIDPEYWQKRFSNYNNDVLWVKGIMRTSGFRVA